MRITELEILNFRGIKSTSILFPCDTRVICLIGSGDSTKSTILQAIEWLLWPSWNLPVYDSDFYECDASSPIVIRGTFSEFSEKLLSEDKYGLYLRKPDTPIADGENDEPADGLPICLTVQLTIDDSLEPQWQVVCNRSEPKNIPLSDRKLLLANRIGANCTKDMMWGKFSVLQKYANAQGVLHDVQVSALRDISQNADLRELDNISEAVTTVGQEFGVGFKDKIVNRMQIQGGSLTTTVGLFDGKSPLYQRGLGSQRLLSMGLNINATCNTSLLLIDEVESGLEPYRLRSLINEFRIKHISDGQVIMTTHSPIAVAECTIGEIMVIHSSNGITEALPLLSENETANKIMQAQIRKNAESFLCKRIIICEGKTEQGFIRALDTFLSKKCKRRMAFEGIGTADGGGSSIFECAKQLLSCGYEVCLFMDSDKVEERVQKDELKDKGISVFDWDEPNAIEEQIFHDVPTEIATKLISIAIDEHGFEPVKNRLSNIQYTQDGEYIKLNSMNNDERREIGSVAKKKKTEWYKRIDLGEAVGDAIFNDWDSIGEHTKLRKVVEDIIKWVTEND